MALAGILGLAGCSSEDAETSAEVSYPVEVVGVMSEYQEADVPSGATKAHESNMTTRAWTPPSGFSIAEWDGKQSIGVCLTQNDKNPETEKTMGFFFYSGEKWRSTVELSAAGDYFLYGYTPDANCSITGKDGTNATFSQGAIMTLTNLPTATSSDVCVVVGARNGTSTDNDNGLKMGDFNYHAQPIQKNSQSGTGNYVFLLFDHLYAAVRLSMAVSTENDFDKLRTIKVKEIRLKTGVDNVNITQNAQAVVTLTANDTGDDPITSIVFTQTGAPQTDTDRGGIIYSGEAKALTTEFQAFPGYFMPAYWDGNENVAVNTLIVTTTYDVYDSKMNLIRQNCEATNNLSFGMFSSHPSAIRKYVYDIKLTIQPTYLYVLSDPDLDNPTVVLTTN